LWSTVRDQLAANTGDHRRRAKAAEPSLLVGLLVDARGERLTPSHAVKKGRRYRYYVSAALITDAGTDRAQGWRLAARQIEEAVIRILSDALTSGQMCPRPRPHRGRASFANGVIRHRIGTLHNLGPSV
jgi:hypothetical protein